MPVLYVRQRTQLDCERFLTVVGQFLQGDALEHRRYGQP